MARLRKRLSGQTSRTACTTDCGSLKGPRCRHEDRASPAAVGPSRAIALRLEARGYRLRAGRRLSADAIVAWNCRRNQRCPVTSRRSTASHVRRPGRKRVPDLRPAGQQRRYIRPATSGPVGRRRRRTHQPHRPVQITRAAVKGNASSLAAVMYSSSPWAGSRRRLRYPPLRHSEVRVARVPHRSRQELAGGSVRVVRCLPVGWTPMPWEAVTRGGSPLQLHGHRSGPEQIGGVHVRAGVRNWETYRALRGLTHARLLGAFPSSSASGSRRSRRSAGRASASITAHRIGAS